MAIETRRNETPDLVKDHRTGEDDAADQGEF
jgi:hypothetical protein